MSRYHPQARAPRNEESGSYFLLLFWMWSRAEPGFHSQGTTGSQAVHRQHNRLSLPKALHTRKKRDTALARVHCSWQTAAVPQRWVASWASLIQTTGSEVKHCTVLACTQSARQTRIYSWAHLDQQHLTARVITSRDIMPRLVGRPPCRVFFKSISF